MKWFNMWFDDAKAVIETMIRNMMADIEVGYDPAGICIRNQQECIAERQMAFDHQMDLFKEMDDVKINRWCYLDLKKRGVIE